MTKNKLFKIWMCACITLSLGACAEETSSDEKGQEDEALVSGDTGKFDSFRRPTEHGALFPQDKASASMANNEIFHAWTFNLSGEADVTLKTQVDKNLDTVMYMYYREPGTSRWGRYIKKNDDHQKNIWSQISLSGAKAGEYRIIVKPFKSALRGNFSVSYDCSGEGCNDRKMVSCSATPFASTKSEATQGCLNQLDAILTAPISFNQPKPDCIQDRAKDLYVEYWDDIIGWDDFADGDTKDDINVNVTIHGDEGFVVQADLGRDEDGLIFVFNNKGEVIYYVHEEQSPIQNWSCAKEGEKELSNSATPNEFCTLDIIHNIQDNDPKNLVAVGTKTKTGGDELHPIAQVVLDYAVDNLGVSKDETVNFEVYDVFDGRAFTARVIIGDPTEPESILIHASKSFSSSVDILYMVSGEESNVDVLCDRRTP